LTPWANLGDIIGLVLFVAITNVLVIVNVIVLNLLMSKRSVEISFLGLGIKLGEPTEDRTMRGSRQK
jgi:hypothetical protein